jgi:cell division protein FtsB
MVVRRRLRSVVLPLFLYAASGSASYYFVNHAHHGERGLKTKKVLKAEISTQEYKLESARLERQDWERRLNLLKSDEIDRDLLEERTRMLLGRVHRNDLVILTPP